MRASRLPFLEVSRMTLNITVLTREAVFQSADFRLTNAETGKLMDNNSQKVMNISYNRWGGLLTYTGLGKWGGKDAGVWLTEWLSEDSALTLDDVTKIITERAYEVLSKLRSPKGDIFHHTFVIALFDEGRPCVVTVSTFEDLFSKPRSRAILPLVVSKRMLRSTSQDALVVVTGQRQAVERSHIRMLKRLGRNTPIDETEAPRLIQAANVAASTRCESVSEDCAVAALFLDGRGRIDVTENCTNPMFNRIMRGTNFGPLLREYIIKIGRDPDTVKMSGWASAHRRPNVPVRPTAGGKRK